MNAVMQTMQGLGSVRVVTLSVVGVILLAAFAILSFRLTSPVLSPLYTNLSAEDGGIIVTELGAMGVRFEVSNSGSEILVDSGDVLRVRMMLAQKGLPRQGSIVGYEIFDKDSTLGTSSFIHDVNLLRALEGELGRTISSLSSVKSARVHLVMPKKELFQKGKIEPSASVVLTLSDRTKVAKNEAVAVRHLVSSAVPGLKPSRVTIIDSGGDILATAAEENAQGMAGSSGSNTEETRSNYESRLRNTIENLLEQAVGVGRVKVQVSAEMGFDRVTTSSEIYDPDGQVARSVQTSEESEKNRIGGGNEPVSVASNLEGSGGSTTSSGGSNSSSKIDEVTNFEISKTITSKVSEVGRVNKISIAVLVDGKYEQGKDGNKVYTPRTDEEIDNLRTLVKTSAGFDEERGDSVEVINMQFLRDPELFIADEGPFDWLKHDLDSILRTIVIGIVAILAILLVIKPLVNRAFEIAPGDLEAEEAHAQAAATAGFDRLPEPIMAGGGEEINLDIIQSRMEGTTSRKINDLIDSNPEETLSVIRTWLSQKT